MTQHSDNYHASLDYLYGRLNYEHLGLPRGSEGLGLGRMRRLMRRLGDPQESYKIIHVAGTKGKG
ncbi:MAG: bifunctional folylpolyglutamate synthase/dihydrofolate synthase, partial [bacterium]